MTPTSFTVSWIDPVAGTRPLSKQVQYRVLGQPIWFDNPAGITQLTTQEVGNPATGGQPLSPDTTYEVRVHVFNSAGQNFSAVIQTHTPLAAVSADGTRVPQDSSSILDANGHTWTIINRQVAVDGVPDGTTANVTNLDYVGGKIWQFNGSLWWYKILPTDAWLPAAGTSVDPLAPPPPPSTGIVFNPGAATPSVGTSGNSVTFDLTSPTTAWLNRAMFGVCDTTYSFVGANGIWDFNTFQDTTKQAIYRSLGAKFVRMHNHTCIGQTFTSYPSTANPNWQNIDSLITGNPLDACFPGAEFMMNLHYSTYMTNTSATAACYAAVAQRLKNAGVTIRFWSICNEANHVRNGVPDFSVAQIAALQTAIASAVHAVDSTYLVGGGDPDGAVDAYLRGQASSGAQFINWHRYQDGSTMGYSDDAVMQAGVQGGEDYRGAFASARAGSPGSYLGGNTEWNLEFASNGSPNDESASDRRQYNYMGAVVQTLHRIHATYSGGAFCAHFRCGIGQDGTYPMLDGSGNLRPPAYALRALNTYMPAGNLVATTLNRSDGFGKLSAMCSTDATNFGAVVVNRDQTLTFTGPITLNHRAGQGSITQFKLDSANINGVTSSVTGPTINVTMLPGSIIVLGGAK